MNLQYVTELTYIELNLLLDIDFLGTKYLASRLGMRVGKFREYAKKLNVNDEETLQLLLVSGYDLELNDIPDDEGDHEFFLVTPNRICFGWFWHFGGRTPQSRLEILSRTMSDYLDADAILIVDIDDKKMVIIHSLLDTLGIVFDPNWCSFDKVDQLIASTFKKSEYNAQPYLSSISQDAENILREIVKLQNTGQNSKYYELINNLNKQLNIDLGTYIYV